MANETIFNRIKQTCSGSGTGNLDILSGTKAVGHSKVASVLTTDGDEGLFILESADEWEAFWGTVVEVDGQIAELARTTPIESSNGLATRITLNALETHTVFMGSCEQVLAYLDQDNKFAKSTVRNAISESIHAKTTAEQSAIVNPLDYQISIKLGDSSVGDGNGGIYYYLTSSWNKLNLTNSIDVDDVTIEIDSGSLQLKDASVTTVKIPDDAVTFAKLPDIAQNRILGRSSVGSGNVEELTSANVKTVLNYQADEVDYDNNTSGMSATDVQSAVDEIENRVDAIEAVVSTQESAITSLTDTTSGTTDGTLDSSSGAVTGVDGTGDNAASKF